MSDPQQWKFNSVRRQFDNIAVVRGPDGVTHSYLNGIETSEIFITTHTFDPLNPWNFPIKPADTAN